VNPLTTKGRYQVTLACDLCEIAWVSPVVEETLETIFAMNRKALCPECNSHADHEDPFLRYAPIVLEIKDLDNEFAIISQF